jgi:tRNA U54 and U55 pseudouridine synthase Pus10
MHGDRFTEDIVDQISPIRMLHRRNSTFRQRQIDRLREI